MPTPVSVENVFSFRGYRVWYRAVGESTGGKAPLLVIHGGAGFPHDYLEPLEAIAETGRQVFFYDQLGCGNSDKPHDPALWSLDLFREELVAVRRELKLDRAHLLGHSWGGMLALEHALTQPPGLESIIISNSFANVPAFAAAVTRLRQQLPNEVREILERHEDARTTDSEEYLAAAYEFYRRHICRAEPWPECVKRSHEKWMRDPEVYRVMNGPSEFLITGKIKDWDISDRLSEIHVPTLVLGGRYDEATPELTAEVHQGIPGSEYVIFENSSHFPFIEETEKYLEVVSRFLDRIDPGR